MSCTRPVYRLARFHEVLLMSKTTSSTGDSTRTTVWFPNTGKYACLFVQKNIVVSSCYKRPEALGELDHY